MQRIPPREGAQSKQDADKEKARRVFKHVMETIRSLDEIAKRNSIYRDLFSSETAFYRNRLKDYCERLMFFDPLEYGRKVEELLWRKVFYDAIQTMKQFKKSAKLPKHVVTSYQAHLMAASGFYTHLLFKLQYEFDLSLDNHVDCCYHPSLVSGLSTNSAKNDGKVLMWVKKACHRCLMYLGDLARYLKEYDGNRSWLNAQRYYYQALHLLPDNGMPHNQLGTLVGTRYYGLDAAYHYIRCMASSSKFQGASGNLQRVFEKNRKRMGELERQIDNKKMSSEQQRVRDVKRFSVKFLHLMDLLYNMKENSQQADAKELQMLCQAVLQDFHFCMFHHDNDSKEQKLGEEKMTYLDDEMVFKCVVLVIIVVHKLQSQGSKQVAAAIALNLALFSHILNHVLSRLQTAFYEAENPSVNKTAEQSEATTDVTLESEEDTEAHIKQRLAEEDKYDDESDDDEEVSRTEVERQRKMARLKRRRRRRTNGEVDLSEGEDDIEPDEILTMISDDEEEMNYLHGDVDSSSSSDSEEFGKLMISQELRPGFLSNATPEQLEEDLSNLNLQAWQKSYANSNSSVSLHALLRGSLANDFVGNEADLLKISSDLMTMNSSIPGLPRADGVVTQGGDNLCIDVAQGRREVSVPPGFDKDPETQHVVEISEKLATFHIDTDTNSSVRTESDQGDSTETESIVDRNEARERQLNHVLRVIAHERLLSVIKVLCDWLLCQPSIINTCTQSSPLLWSRLSFFLNFLPTEIMIAKQNYYQSKSVLSHVRNLSLATSAAWKQVYPLREDVNLHNLAMMSDTSSAIDFEQQIPLTSMEESLLRVCCLRNFGYKMAQVTGSSFTFNQEKTMFFGPSTDPTAQNQTAQVQMADMDTRRNQLMKDMAQLRLQAEVSQLKDSVRSGENRNLPPYIVPDSSALCETMPLIKQLVHSTRFIVIVPLAVIDHLDAMKKESQNSRDAIRWLEAEFRKGNRYIRSQKHYERPNMGNKNFRRKEREAWRLLQIVDCCKYLSQQNPECHPSGMVSILTNDNFITHESQKLQQLVQHVQQEGVVIHNVKEFHAKWKEQWQKKG